MQTRFLGWPGGVSTPQTAARSSVHQAVPSFGKPHGIDRVTFSGTSPVAAAEVDAYFPNLKRLESWMFEDDVPKVRERLAVVIECLKQAATGQEDPANIERFNQTRRELDALMGDAVEPMYFSHLGPIVLPRPDMLEGAYLKGIDFSFLEFVAYEPPPEPVAAAKGIKRAADWWKLRWHLEPPPLHPVPTVVSFRKADIRGADFRLRQFAPHYKGPKRIDLTGVQYDRETRINRSALFTRWE